MLRVFAAVWAAVTLALCQSDSIVAAGTPAAPKPATHALLEDNAETLLKQLTNPTGDPGEGHVEKGIVFSGQSSIKIVPMQRFSPGIAGWDFRITEKPGPGEYRYLRFAWKADGCAGIMIQLHDAKDWNIRYTAGIDQPNWGSKFVAKQPPAEWTLVTCDLFKDFGERNLRGIALTAFNGRAAYFDHIYLGRSVDDLDRIDATGLDRAKAAELSAADLDRLWTDLAGVDASKAYRAFWRLVATPKRAVPFLKTKLVAVRPKGDAAQFRQWIGELDDESFVVREAASEQLAKHLEAASDLLQASLSATASAEVRRRIQALLAARTSGEQERERLAKAVRILEYVNVPESRACLEALASTVEASWLADAARAALERLGTPPG